MKGLPAKITRTLQPSTRLVCDDNSGAKELNIFSVFRTHGVRGRPPRAGIGDVVFASVRKGKQDMVGKKVRALIIRQTKEFRRKNGWRVKFSDNAAVLVTEDGLPVGTEIKGVVAREIYDRYPKVSAIAPGIV
ncbi:MAG: uL14 family ribosomal protein [Candidatus Bilamarchaeaceae archaeon]